MTELEILKHRVEILEKGFQEIIAILEKFGKKEGVEEPEGL